MADWRNRIVGTDEVDPKILLPNPKNYRRHPNGQMDALEGALDEIGWIAPVTVNKTTGKILDGHARVELALRQAVSRVPVQYVELTEAEESLALATLDPIGAMATHDVEALDALLHEVQTGSAGLQALLADVAAEAGLYKPEIVEDEAPVDRAEELRAKWGVESGQMWRLGEHRIVCGDCTDVGVVQRVMAGEKAQAVVTDPPYGMALDTDWSDAVGLLRLGGAKNGTRGNKYAPVIGDDKPFDPAPIFEAWGYCQEIFLWGADYYAESIPNRSDGSWLVWDKRKPSQSEALGSEFELCWSKAKHKRRILRYDWFGFLSSVNPAEARNRQHPTQKPTSLVGEIIERWTERDQIVVDAYLGSGTTLIACEQLGRKCRAIEISPGYVAVAVERWVTLTGGTPELLVT